MFIITISDSRKVSLRRFTQHYKKLNMKFCISLLFALFVLEPVEAQTKLYLVIRTVFNGVGLPSTQVQSATSAMTTEKSRLDGQVTLVANVYKSAMISETTTTTTNNLTLRGRELQGCNYCPGYPTGYYCWVNGVRRPACRRELDFVVHETKDETELSQMSEGDRQRHLQAGSMCADAKEDVVEVVKEDIANGHITAPFSSFTFECLYEVA
jgi:hypothetical protein